jgi:hypothetical protein
VGRTNVQICDSIAFVKTDIRKRQNFDKTASHPFSRFPPSLPPPFRSLRPQPIKVIQAYSSLFKPSRVIPGQDHSHLKIMPCHHHPTIFSLPRRPVLHSFIRRRKREGGSNPVAPRAKSLTSQKPPQPPFTHFSVSKSQPVKVIKSAEKCDHPASIPISLFTIHYSQFIPSHPVKVSQTLTTTPLQGSPLFSVE